MPAIEIDPYSASEGLFECVGCGSRERASNYPVECPSCGGEVRNIAVSRE